VWREDQSDADVATGGAQDVLGTTHDVPDSEACERCHDIGDRLIGFSAIQIAGDLSTALSNEGRFSTAPPERLDLPGTEREQALLGYLHGNCGQCHHGGGENPLDLWLSVSGLGAFSETGLAKTAIGAETHAEKPLSGIAATKIVEAGDPDQSLLYVRMSRRSEGAMPPIASERVDEEAAAMVADWIRSLPR
jgi:hypothetical protein